ncbi:sugar phosphate isomerase/epimerase family protein [Ensifer adhaerens]|uniref:sugar phosphate isomerase/epimerase family protein n=1 Tax=Ensifer adhaerens TaxID=106592 RepID=UPI000CF121D1|nr:TIM barrel protein [Ensifer adhaerens]
MLKLSLNNGFAMKRWPEPEVWADLIATRMGISDVQLSLDLVDLTGGPKWHERQASRIRTACKNNGIAISSVFSGLIDYCGSLLLHPDAEMRVAALERYKRGIEFCALVGADTFGGHMGAYSVADYLNLGRRRALAQEQLERVSELSNHAGQAGLRYLLWEPMPIAREYPSTIAECLGLAERFAEMTGAVVAYCYDVGHACRSDLPRAEQDPYLWLSSLGHLSPIVHLQQTDGKRDHHWCFTEETNKVGVIHPEQVLTTITNTPASVVEHLTIEVFPAFEMADDQVLADVTSSCNYWRDGLTNAG